MPKMFEAPYEGIKKIETKRVKIQIFNTNVRSVLLYAVKPGKLSTQKARRLQIMINKNTSLMQLISNNFTYSKSLHVSGRTLPIIRRI